MGILDKQFLYYFCFASGWCNRLSYLLLEMLTSLNSNAKFKCQSLSSAYLRVWLSILWEYPTAYFSCLLHFLLKSPQVPDAIAFDSVILCVWVVFFFFFFSGKAWSVGGVSHKACPERHLLKNTENTLCPCMTEIMLNSATSGHEENGSRVTDDIKRETVWWHFWVIEPSLWDGFLSFFLPGKLCLSLLHDSCCYTTAHNIYFRGNAFFTFVGMT